MKSIIGIDPGAKGGLVLLTESRVEEFKMPATERDLLHLIETMAAGDNCHVLIEAVNTGFSGTGKASMAKLYGNYMSCRMALIATEVPFEAISSAKWQRFWNLPTSKDCGGDKTKKKNLHKAKAQELFPTITVTHSVSDALLIAEYGRRIQ